MTSYKLEANISVYRDAIVKKNISLFSPAEHIKLSVDGRCRAH